jgi:predicted phosphoribosyltransferase
MFRNREEAARRLADVLRSFPLHDPLILAIPNGGVVIGAILAKELGMELDVLLCRKLRSPHKGQSLGAVSESGSTAFDRTAGRIEEVTAETLVEERARQLAEIFRQRESFRQVRAPAFIAGRSVVVADEGMVTGTIMSAALGGFRRETVFELIAAIPVASPTSLQAIRSRCDRIACVAEVDPIGDLHECYAELEPVGEDEALRLVKQSVA